VEAIERWKGRREEESRWISHGVGARGGRERTEGMGREEGEGGRREDGGREKGSRFSEKMREAGRGNRLRADCQEWTLSEFQTEVRELVSTPKKPRR
jgi:hypothetical protein